MFRGVFPGPWPPQVFESYSRLSEFMTTLSSTERSFSTEILRVAAAGVDTKEFFEAAEDLVS